MNTPASSPKSYKISIKDTSYLWEFKWTICSLLHYITINQEPILLVKNKKSIVKKYSLNNFFKDQNLERKKKSKIKDDLNTDFEAILLIPYKDETFSIIRLNKSDLIWFNVLDDFIEKTKLYLQDLIPM